MDRRDFVTGLVGTLAAAPLTARPALAHSLHDYATMLLARDRRGDREKALDLLGEAASIYQELGLDRWAQAAGALKHA